MKNILVLLVKTHFKPVLNDSREIGHCKVDLCNVHIKLHNVCVKIKTTLEQKIVELVRLNTTGGVKNVDFSSFWIRVGTRDVMECFGH